VIEKDVRPGVIYVPAVPRTGKSQASRDRASLRTDSAVLKNRTTMPNKPIDDTSLDASHAKMRDILAIQVEAISRNAEGGLTTREVELLGKMAGIWRTLVQNEPAPDLSDLSQEQLEAQLDSVKARGK
jgi:cobalamin biosynthesis protein CobT